MKKKILLTIACLLLITGCKDVKLSNGENAIVTFSEGGISSDDYYKVLKESYGANEKLVNLIDTYLLNKKYEKTDEETSYVNQNVKSIKSAAEENNYDFNLYLNYYYGFSSEDELRDYLRLTYKRNTWTSEYAKTQVTDKQISEYFDNYIYGDIEASQILITIDVKSDASEDEKTKAESEALEKAKEVIKKLKAGEDFAKLAKEYSKDASTSSNGGSLGKVNSDDVSTEVFNALVDMKDNTYSTTPVKSSYGYHILFRTSQDDKPALDDTLKEKIISTIAEELASTDGFAAKALIALREENDIKFVDTELEKEYKDLIN